MGIFEEILAKAEDSDRAVLEKYPELKQSMEKLENAAVDYAKWYAANWDEEHGMTRGEWAARQQLQELQARLEALEANPGSMSDEHASSLLEDARRAGLLSHAEVQKILDERLKQYQEQTNQVLSGMQAFYGQVYGLGFKHKDEFGEPLDPNELWNYMVRTGVRDPKVAYEQMVAPKRAEIQAKQQEQLLKEAEERGAQRARQELAMGGQNALPTDTSGGIIGVTHMPVPQGEIPQDLQERAKGMNLRDPALASLGVEALRRGVLPTQ